ncbi:FAD/NAD(P)-binding domain-containing protein [Durotheca rogersii]|uniref:FAD/NAD(P)-binding domain-containing protein n=1 Tax=Durotheca rogersii TaxID=419775 RepID=UPI00221ED4DF|nr:FAD/NAD(P)-binding domain-containing protein [Durotheca rogersii]KAI5865246.1 FAD/NAD(P)-binding domain-containing protein [Durotheca rogersii]
MAAQKPFRAVIVGGGLVALTTAHIFTSAGIDFVILERHDNLAPQIGSLLNVWPPTFRVFDQLGLTDAVLRVATSVNRVVSLSADDGIAYSVLEANEIIQKNHGYGIQVTHRPHFIDALYQTLPDDAKARIKVGKQVVNLRVSDDGVVVECADGTVEEGSIVVGADGVYSRVRECMQAMVDGRSPLDKSPLPASPYVTTYRLLIANIPIPSGLPKNNNFEGMKERVSVQVLTGDDRAWFGIYEALDEPTSERIRYTEEDKAKMVERWGHLYAAPGWRVRDVYALRRGDVGLIHLEEGLLDHWTHRRVVLMGDAVRKLEPHAGLGYNSGVIDAVVLGNKLRRLLQDGPSPSTEALEALFAEYEKERLEDMPGVVKLSMRRARTATWLTRWNWIMAKYIVPWTGLSALSLRYVYGRIVAAEPVLEWLEEKRLPPSALPYLHHPLLDGDLKKPQKRQVPRSVDSLSILTSAITLAALAAVGFRFYRRLF